MKNQMLSELLSREMSRKEFLLHIGSAVLVMFGVSGLLKGLLQMKSPTPQLRQSGHYGSSSYGGLNR